MFLEVKTVKYQGTSQFIIQRWQILNWKFKDYAVDCTIFLIILFKKLLRNLEKSCQISFCIFIHLFCDQLNYSEYYMQVSLHFFSKSKSSENFCEFIKWMQSWHSKHRKYKKHYIRYFDKRFDFKCSHSQIAIVCLISKCISEFLWAMFLCTHSNVLRHCQSI